jgi:hypothetical protein
MFLLFYENILFTINISINKVRAYLFAIYKCQNNIVDEHLSRKKHCR